MVKKLSGCCKMHKNIGHGCGGGIYCLGFIGALIFFMQQASGFWSVILGILKALVWPVFVVLKILGL
jgi:hypothetical protein